MTFKQFIEGDVFNIKDLSPEIQARVKAPKLAEQRQIRALLTAARQACSRGAYADSLQKLTECYQALKSYWSKNSNELNPTMAAKDSIFGKRLHGRSENDVRREIYDAFKATGQCLSALVKGRGIVHYEGIVLKTTDDFHTFALSALTHSLPGMIGLYSPDWWRTFQ